MSRLLSTKEVAARLGVSTKTIVRYEKAKRLTAIRLSSRAVRYEETDVNRLIADSYANHKKL